MELDNISLEKMGNFLALQYSLEELKEFNMGSVEFGPEHFDFFFNASELISVIDKCLEMENGDEYFKTWFYKFMDCFFKFTWCDEQDSNAKTIIKFFIDSYINRKLVFFAKKDVLKNDHQIIQADLAFYNLMYQVTGQYIETCGQLN